MNCPYRKITQTVNDITSEYYSECYGNECPWYRQEYQDVLGRKHREECKRVEADYYRATHLGGTT